MMRYVHQPPNPQQREALSPAAEAMADPQALPLRRTLQQFSPEAQQVALLYYLCEMSLAEICQITRQSELRVRTTLNQVKRQLCR
jgi:DNA-directed RNA polymerase specialized sigma24 family protein